VEGEGKVGRGKGREGRGVGNRREGRGRGRGGEGKGRGLVTCLHDAPELWLCIVSFPRKRDVRRKSRFLHTPAFHSPVREVPVGILP